MSSSLHPPAPELLTGTVAHARVRPEKHRFVYPVYQLRLPLRQKLNGTALLSINRFNLQSFHAADHGDGQTPLTDWIDGILRAEGILDADGEVWLHCFPRVLGYVFNPVSFWFCERRDGTVRAVLCEVNNTFGERHCYLLAHDDGSPLAHGERLRASKIFHVSPFCTVSGHYIFRFERDGHRHDVHIDHADDDGILLCTRITGTAGPLTTRSALSAFVRMPMMTIGVIARIHWQALRLWLRGVPFFSKPEPPAIQVSR